MTFLILGQYKGSVDDLIGRSDFHVLAIVDADAAATPREVFTTALATHAATLDKLDDPDSPIDLDSLFVVPASAYRYSNDLRIPVREIFQELNNSIREDLAPSLEGKVAAGQGGRRQ